MRTNELMIGDWVYIFGNPKKIEGIRLFKNGDKIVYYDGDNGNFIENVTPILLTEEILEKNGFKKIVSDYGRVYYELGLNEYNNKLLLCNNSAVIDFEGNDIYLCDCEYVHELRHILKSCKIEKEIIL